MATKSCPAPTVRESIETPETVTSRVRWPPVARSSSRAVKRAAEGSASGAIPASIAQRFENARGLLAVVEVDRPVLENLVRLVALAGEDDRVAGRGRADRRLDGGAPVHLRLVRPAALAGAGLDFGD